MHQNFAVILQQFNYCKNSFIAVVPEFVVRRFLFLEQLESHLSQPSHAAMVTSSYIVYLTSPREVQVREEKI